MTTESDRAPRRTIALAAIGSALVLLASAIVYGAMSGHDDDPDASTGMFALAPGGVIDPADVPEALQTMYRGAEAHADAFAAVPCFCGCEEMLGHRHLLDCFVRPDGDGWEAHAAGCAVCLGEAAQVLDLVAAGATTPEIVEAVGASWSDPYLTEE